MNMSIRELLIQHGHDRSSLLPLLQALQHRDGMLADDALRELSAESGISLAHITETASFFSAFRRTQGGKHHIRVCTGAACHVKGAEILLNAFRRELKISPGEETSADGLFTVSGVGCLGCCMLAPAVQIDERILGPVTAEQIPDLLEAAFENRLPDTSLGGDYEPEACVCLCSSCSAAGSADVFEALKKTAFQNRFPLKVREVGCTGLSFLAPLVRVTDSQGRIFHYVNVDASLAEKILGTHFTPGNPLKRARFKFKNLAERLHLGACGCRPHAENTQPYESGQLRIVTEKSGQMTPLDLDEYRAHGGFEALLKVREGFNGEILLRELSLSGLRGRGGGGFRTAEKWRNVFEAHAEYRFVICNADEGDPGAFMDRMLLESFPYRVLEGMLIAGELLNARTLYIYIREEYARARQILCSAVEKCEAAGLIEPGKVRLFAGAGAFVCGEEGALLESMEGKRGIPRERPPFPAECGLHGKPTLINNVETFAAVPWIVRHGGEAFAQYGSESSSGSKTFALAGKIRRGGLIEVPMGMSIEHILYAVGGGPNPERKLKAVQIGGPSGGCIPASDFALPVDFDSLKDAGAMMGSGGLVALDDTDCMVDMARYFLRFTVDESCGRCTFCRIGLKRMLEILDRLVEGKGKSADLEMLETLGKQVREGSRCGLGKTAPNPLLSALRHFRGEFEAHIAGYCPAGKCVKLLEPLVTKRCIGCTRCSQVCPDKAIAFTPFERASIDLDRCTRCKLCFSVCPRKAIIDAKTFAESESKTFY